MHRYALLLFFSTSFFTLTAQNDVFINSKVGGTVTKATRNFSKAKSIKVYGTINPDDIKTLGKLAHRYHNIERIDIRNCSGISVIADSAFFNCQYLKEIKLPKSVKTIGNAAFMHCTSLKKIQISDSVAVYGDYSFYNNKSLQTLHLSKHAERIGYKAFAKCANLSNIAIPANTKELGDEAFGNCSNLHSITFYPANPPKMNGNVFVDCSNESCVVYVNPCPSTSIKAFSNHVSREYIQ